MRLTLSLSVAGCAGWQDFGYNRKQQTRQCILILVGSLCFALFFTLM